MQKSNPFWGPALDLLSGFLFFLLALGGGARGGEGRGMAGGLEVVKQLVPGGELVVAGDAVHDAVLLWRTLQKGYDEGNAFLLIQCVR